MQEMQKKSMAISNNIQPDKLFGNGVMVCYKVLYNYDSISCLAQREFQNVRHCKTWVVPRYNLQCKKIAYFTDLSLLG